MTKNIDRLYELIPSFCRMKDEDQGYPLRALLQVIAEQINVVEEDIDQLYNNWFIETCQDWAVPYIGDLIGYRQVREATTAREATSSKSQERSKMIIPRREVANTIQYRRRKGTLALLDLLAKDIAGWPSHAAEVCRSVGFIQNINHLQTSRGNTIDLHKNVGQNRIDGPFNDASHTLDLRSVGSNNRLSYNNAGVCLFVWRLKAYPATMTPAYCVEDVGHQYYTFSVLGDDVPLYTHADTESAVEELNYPMPIKRWALEAYKDDYYGEGKSIQIWTYRRQNQGGNAPFCRVDPERIVSADLSKWQNYKLAHEQVAVDPETGRIAFSSDSNLAGVLVSYYYGFSSDIGGGEYDRQLSQHMKYEQSQGHYTAKPLYCLYQVGSGKFESISDALEQWQRDKMDPEKEQAKDRLMNAVIEITENNVYVEPMEISLGEKESLQIRSANHVRPVLRLLDWQTSSIDSLKVTGLKGSSFTLDGLLIEGRGLQVTGDLAKVTIRHSTLVPGWVIHHGDETNQSLPSLELLDTQARVFVDQSIMGPIEIIQNAAITDPISLHISGSVLDAMNAKSDVVYSSGSLAAHVQMTVLRSTIIGNVRVHAIGLCEDSIFYGQVKVARRQLGCMRFCYVSPGSRTPRRYGCQPDLAIISAKEEFRKAVRGDKINAASQELEAIIRHTADKVRPRFNSEHFGNPAYCQLSSDCALEIKRGAEDESEMGVFHDLYQPQREANLRIRLGEYTPAGMEAGLVFMS